MVRTRVIRSLLCGALAIGGTFALLQPAEAGPVRVRFTPPYGAPFPDLYWYGEAVIDDGDCTASGNVSNIVGACAGDFSITSARVYFAQNTPPNTAPVPLAHIDFVGAQVISVNRDSPAPPDWEEIVSSPFNPQQVPGNLTQTLYDPLGSAPPAQAWFSLMFIGGYAQLYWFQNDPGDPLLNPLGFPYVQWPNAAYYVGCYLAGPGDHTVGLPYLGVPNMQCGLSSNVEGNANGARLFGFADATAVPEPGTLALMFAAGLGAAVLRARRRYI